MPRTWRRRNVAAVVALVVLLVAGAVLFDIFPWSRPRPASTGEWVGVGSLASVNRAGVVYLPDHEVFVVSNGSSPVAVSAVVNPARNDLGRRVLYCPSNGGFHGGLGTFDHFGFYWYGPAARGLDRVVARVRDGFVEVRPGDPREGPPRSATRSRPGVVTCDWGGQHQSRVEGPPGFVRPAFQCVNGTAYCVPVDPGSCPYTESPREDCPRR